MKQKALQMPFAHISDHEAFITSERIVLALHLAVIISFTEVAPFFNALHKMTGVSMTLGEFSAW